MAPNDTGSTGDIRAVIDGWRAALQTKNAARMQTFLLDPCGSFSLAPPLWVPEDGGDGLEDWFATWRGSIGYDLRDVTIEAGDEVAFAYGLAHMTGEKTDGETVSLWFRLTVGLRNTSDGWKIVHQHESVPFYMDGSFRAAVDLEPETANRPNP